MASGSDLEPDPSPPSRGQALVESKSGSSLFIYRLFLAAGCFHTA